MMRLGNLICFAWLLLCCGCGYQFGQGLLPSKYCTISVPYVKGDKTGEFTATLIKEIARSGGFRYLDNNSADLILSVCILDYCEENIGFRYDHNRKNKLIHSIIPTEARITAFIEVTVRETCSGSIVLGPAQLDASVDFDHDYYYSPDGINEFSLGQLTDYDVAYDTVQRPLNKALARKVVDYLNYSW